MSQFSKCCLLERLCSTVIDVRVWFGKLTTRELVRRLFILSYVNKYNNNKYVARHIDSAPAEDYTFDNVM